jgi:hypothetical protein
MHLLELLYWTFVTLHSFSCMGVSCGKETPCNGTPPFFAFPPFPICAARLHAIHQPVSAVLPQDFQIAVAAVGSPCSFYSLPYPEEPLLLLPATPPQQNMPGTSRGPRRFMAEVWTIALP